MHAKTVSSSLQGEMSTKHTHDYTRGEGKLELAKSKILPKILTVKLNP